VFGDIAHDRPVTTVGSITLANAEGSNTSELWSKTAV
jgi:hypothetical protein